METRTQTQIEQAALDAASAGANPPPADRLRAAAEYVLDRAQPDQLILFGSAARGEFGAESDFDFAVVRGAGNGEKHKVDHESWYCDAADAEIDALFIDADSLEARRWEAGRVQCSILSEGATVFAVPGAARIETIRDAGGSLADIAELVKQGRYKTGVAAETADRARHRLRSAEWSAGEQYWNLACDSLQDACEFALKALIAANGSPAGYGRNLAALWRRAAALGEAINPKPDEDGLTVLTECATEGRESGGDDEEGAVVFHRMHGTTTAFVEQAEKRVKELTEHGRYGH